jgi:peptidoglycan hydrolase-like protein with peptidoglycan-binding domain
VKTSRLLVVGAVAGAVIVPAVPAHADAKAFGKRTLRQGMQGHDVKVLQRYLNRVGVRTTADGEFGPRTGRSVRAWEADVRRRVNGTVSRPDARTLKHQVQTGTRVAAPAPAPAPAPTAAPASGKATLNANGTATAPGDAPAQVKSVIAAANRIVGKPYKYGGGHGQWEDSGYDCSGSESYALHGGGFVKSALTSSDYESWGRAGKGTWITSYANSGHSYLVVAGLRFDTGYHSGPSGPAWSAKMRPSDGYVARHPAGF